VEDQHAAVVALLGDVARAYIDLRGAQRSLTTARRIIASNEELLDLTRQRRAAGLTSEVDVVESAAELSATQAQLPIYELAITQSINQLSRLLGLPPGALQSELEGEAAAPLLPPTVPLGLPADLARRRPDIRRAEANLHQATAEIGVAIAGLYPRLTLTGAGGTQSETAGEVTEWASRFFTLGPTLELPVLDRGQWRTVTLQRVRAREAAVVYAGTVLNALQEVEDARAAYDADQDRDARLEATVEQDRDALELTRQRYGSGVASFIEVLDAERTLRQNELSRAQSATVVGEDLVSLYRALGGGWE
jgi:NodT family efflux transporter outer membrane factor (OMF) lipoprotein